MERFIESHMKTFNLELRDVIYSRNNDVKDSDKAKIKEMYNTMEKLLEGQDWFTDIHMTIVDLSYIKAISVFVKHVPISEKDYPRITAWMARCKEVIKTHRRGTSTTNDENLTNLVMAAVDTTPE